MGLQQIEVVQMLSRHKSWINRRLALIDSLQTNDVISRRKNGQSIRAIAKTSELGRQGVARVVRQHLSQIQSADPNSRPACFGEVRFTRKSKLNSFIDYVEKSLLNGRSFRNLEQLNEVACGWLSEVNDRRIHGTTKRTPLELQEEEKPRLLELPTIRFDTAQVIYRTVDIWRS